MRTLAALVTAALLLTLPAAAGAPPAGAPAVAGVHSQASAAAAALPGLRVTRIVGGLDHPWDVAGLGKGRFLVTQRERRRLTLVRSGWRRPVTFSTNRVWSSGETGLMGLEVDPRFGKNRRVYTCSGWSKVGGGHDIRVIAWRLDKGLRRARLVRVLVRGIPVTSGRHGGCRLLVTRNGSLLVGTGDAAVGSNPRNRSSLGGKTLRLSRWNGKRWPGNPWAGAKGNRRYVYTFGHRNVQGLAQRNNGSLWSIEQGTYRDDEVNRLWARGDYGYHPVPGYNEQVPMTDHRLPGPQVGARWRSGRSTIATSGGTFVPYRGWRGLGGFLAVASLKGQRVLFLRFNRRGALIARATPPALTRHGRIRTVAVAPDRSLLVTTDNGNGRDVLLRVRPR